MTIILIRSIGATLTEVALQRARELAAETNELARLGLLDDSTLDHLRRDALDCLLALERSGALDEVPIDGRVGAASSRDLSR